MVKVDPLIFMDALHASITPQREEGEFTTKEYQARIGYTKWKQAYDELMRAVSLGKVTRRETTKGILWKGTGK